ncbi:MAG: hypothetical protein P8X89_01755 [Reinekea sp.]
MDRFNLPYHYTDYDYNPVYQEDGQHTFAPETGQTSRGTAANEMWGRHPSGSYSAPGQSYPNPNLPAQIPSSPRSDWDYLLRTPEPMPLEDIIHSQIHWENDQHAFQPETGQTYPGGAANGSCSAPGQPQPYQDLNPSAQIPSWLRPDWGTSQPITLEDIGQHHAPPESSNPLPAVETRCRKAPLKERFLAGLAAFAQGAPLKHCSPSLRFTDYIHSDGCMVKRGIPLYNQLSDAEKTLLDQAIIARQRAKHIRSAGEESVTEPPLEGIDHYAQDVSLTGNSATIAFKNDVTRNGHSDEDEEELSARLLPEDQARVNQALLPRKVLLSRLSRSSGVYRERSAPNSPAEGRFLAGLDKYAQGVSLKECSSTLPYKCYVTDNGFLRPPGEALRKNLLEKDQDRLDKALLSRRALSMANVRVAERFLAGLDNYAKGVKLNQCSPTLAGFGLYASNNGTLYLRGLNLRATLSPEDQARVDEALTARRRIIARVVDQFIATLEPYGNGLTLQQCGESSGLQKDVFKYFTQEGGLTLRGDRLIENLQPDQQADVWSAIEKRRQFMNSSAQVSGLPWQWPETLPPMPEPGGMEPPAMVDPMQTEAMWASAWQLTGQAVPGTWGMPSESAESSIPQYGREAVGADFQHQYGPYGLMPQIAPDRLVGRGIEDRMLINIQGEVYRVQYMGSSSEGATNENPYGTSFMLVPRFWGG